MLHTLPIGRAPTAYYKLESITSATQVPGNGAMVLLQAETAAVRYRLDAIDPTANTGHVLAGGESILLTVPPTTIRVIENAMNAVLHVTTFK